MPLSTFAVGAAVLALCGQAAATDSSHAVKAGSLAKCDITAVSKSSSLSVSVAKRAVERVDAVLCGPKEEVNEHASSSSHAIASAFAETIAEVVVDCYAKGHASFQVRGKSVAYAQATALAKAYAAAYATAHTCHKCSAASELVVESYEEIFLHATSEVHIELEGIATGTEVATASSAFIHSFVNKTVTAFAESIVDARAAADSCEVFSEINLHAGDVEAANTGTCTVGVVSASDEKISNGGVAIATSVSAKACGRGFAGATFEVEAEALGKVMSIAVTEISADCVIKGNGSACVLGKGHITNTAEAVATAFASGFASATNKCGTLCDSNTTVVSRAIGSVLATATSEIYDRQCGGSNSHFDINALDKDVVNATTTALASILTNVSATSTGECHIYLAVDTEVTPAPHQAGPGHPPGYKSSDGPSSPSHHDPHVLKGVPQHQHTSTHPKSAMPSRPSGPKGKRLRKAPASSHQPLKPIKNYRVKHGSVTNSQSASHRQKARLPARVHRKRVVAKKAPMKPGPVKRTLRLPKKMFKYNEPSAHHRRKGHPKTMKVRALIQRKRAALKLLAKRAKSSNSGIPKKARGRKPMRPHQGRSRTRASPKARRSRRPRQPRRIRKPHRD